MANIFGKSVTAAGNSVRNSLQTLGRAALHSLAPDEIEYYMCSLELFDSNRTSKGLLLFHVMPSNIVDNKTQIANISKTKSGVTTDFSSTYNPRDISIEGNFGRRIRLVAGSRPPEVSPRQGEEPVNGGKSNFVDNFNNITEIGNVGFSIGNIGVLVKTGYGLITLLRQIIELSWTVDSRGNPYVLVFNNYALNTSDVVEVLQRSFAQSQESNMIWSYSLEMRTTAPGSAVTSKSRAQFLTEIASGEIAKGLTNIITAALGSL